MTTIINVVENQGLKFHCRMGTTDEKVIPEVIGHNNYFRRDFLEPEPNDYWADLGGNIGTFSILVASKGCQVCAFEPEPSNVKIFNDNIILNDLQESIEIRGIAVTAFGGDQLLFLSKGRNKYRHTLVRSIRGRDAIMVKSIPFSDIIALGVNAVKMDIEGSELEIFDNVTDWGNITKLTFEYHFDFDRLIANFHNRVKKLNQHFTDIYYGKIPDRKTYDYYPAARTVYCVVA